MSNRGNPAMKWDIEYGTLQKYNDVLQSGEDGVRLVSSMFLPKSVVLKRGRDCLCFEFSYISPEDRAAVVMYTTSHTHSIGLLFGRYSQRLVQAILPFKSGNEAAGRNQYSIDELTDDIEAMREILNTLIKQHTANASRARNYSIARHFLQLTKEEVIKYVSLRVDELPRCDCPHSFGLHTE
jgi:hypothetical protein